LIVEGAGGALVPLNQDALIVDLIAHLDIPTIVVARSTLGTINHTLLTLEALRKRNIDVLGVILNGPPNAGNAKAIEFYGDTKVLFHIPVIENDFAKHLSDLASLYTNENRRTTASGAAR
jgi:dethiobiotin synthetase